MLLTRPPLLTEVKALDLHVLSPPLAFALSQDQTLQFNLWSLLVCSSLHSLSEASRGTESTTFDMTLSGHVVVPSST